MGNAVRFELSPLNGRKSFGGKCHAWRFPGGEFSLVSFGTLVATWRGGKLHRHWEGETTLQCVFASLFVWSTITAFYFQYLEYNIWAAFFVGIPVQIALILGAKLRRAGVHWLHR